MFKFFTDNDAREGVMEYVKVIAAVATITAFAHKKLKKKPE